MRIGELFAGIGGLGIAAQWTFGGSVAWQADLVGEKVRRRHFPEAVQVVGDVREVNPGALEPVDVLCAGFACQDLSVAGPQASKEDLHAGARTGTTYRETLRFVGALRPRFVVLENVPALLNHRATLERDLAGYGLTWVLCGANDAGAPHLRRRVFILAERDVRGRGLVEVTTDRQWSPDESEREWPTPTLCGNDNRKGASATSGDGLGTAVRQWTTVTASESKGRRTSIARRDDPDMLSEQVRMWGTPRVGGGGARLVEDDKGRLEAQIRPCLGSRLNPRWVETLMGYPIGWTCPEGERLTPERSPRYPRGRYPEGWDRSQLWQGFPWEPFRTLPDGPPAPGRPAQLAALGNAVHPQQGHLALTTAMQPQQLGLPFTTPTCLESAA